MNGWLGSTFTVHALAFESPLSDPKAAFWAANPVGSSWPKAAVQTVNVSSLVLPCFSGPFHKIRLTRSLSDFARIVEIFDEGGVSFVSVTQQFNTTTSMGRFTLNMLLSFAPFEREVTGERIRDKIAASKRKGMWMGGVVPLGYDVVDRKLVLNVAEAETVRTLFRLYLKHSNVRPVEQEADQPELRAKARKPNNGRRPGSVPFTRRHIYRLLSNAIYVGDIVHKGERFEGEHKAIIDHEVRDAVQEQLRSNAVTRRHDTNTKTRALLIGLLVDAEGRKMVPTYANKAGRRYRYYISKPLKETSADTDVGWRLPAPAIEDVVVTEICRLFCDRPRLIEALCLTRTPPDHLGAILSRSSNLGYRLRAAIPSVGDLVKHHGIDQGDVSRRLPLAFLAPDIIEAILGGRQPIELTAARMMRIRDLPLSWAEQRQRLGFAD